MFIGKIREVRLGLGLTNIVQMIVFNIFIST